MRRVRSIFGIGALALLITASTVGQDAPIVLGQINLSFYAVTGAVIEEVLEERGYAVEVQEAAHRDLYPLLGEGKIDLLVAAWLPYAHANYWSRYGDQAIELATLYEGAQLFWGVPDYVPESAVRSVEDLAKPEVASRMMKDIQGSGQSSGLMRASTKMMAEYGLEEAGYRLLYGTGQDRTRAFREAVAEKRWVVVPLARPHFLNQAYRIRRLSEPKGLLGGANRGVLIGHKSLPDKVSAETLAVLRRVRLGTEAVNEMDYLVNVAEKSPREAARIWMDKNAWTVKSWMASE